MDLGRAAGPVAERLLLTGRDRLGVVLLGQVLGLGAGHVAGEDHHVQRAVGACVVPHSPSVGWVPTMSCGSRGRGPACELRWDARTGPPTIGADGFSERGFVVFADVLAEAGVSDEEAEGADDGEPVASSSEPQAASDNARAAVATKNGNAGQTARHGYLR